MNLSSTKKASKLAKKTKNAEKKPRTGDRLINALKSSYSSQNWEDKFDNHVIEFCELTYTEAINQLNELLKRAGQAAKKVTTAECFGHEYGDPDRIMLVISQLAKGLKAVRHGSAITGRIVEGEVVPIVLLQLGDEARPITFGLKEGHDILRLEKTYQVFRELFWFLRNWEFTIRALWGARLFGEIGRLITASRKALPVSAMSSAGSFGLADCEMSSALYTPWVGPLRNEIDLADFSDEDLKEISKVLNTASRGSEGCEERPVYVFHDWMKKQPVSEMLSCGLSIEDIKCLVCGTGSRLGPRFEVELQFDQPKGRFLPRIPLSDHRGDGGRMVELAELPFTVAMKFFGDTAGLPKEDLTRLLLREYYQKAAWLVREAKEDDLL